MDRYCVVGNPVAHSRSPWIQARFAALTGQAIEYDRLLLPLDGFAAGIADLRAQGARGCNVTVPFKFEAAALPGARLTPRARRAGAANTLRFDADGLLADNTDGIGLVRDITVNAGVPLAGARVLLVGAGGAAAGVLGPLLEARPAALDVANRTADKAATLAHSHAGLAAEVGAALRGLALEEVGAGYDIVINATAASLGGGPIPVPDAAPRPGGLVVDMMYGDAARPFLDWARERGAQPRDGLGMLVEQAAESFTLWRGVRPPAAQVLGELRAAIAAGAA